MSNLIERLTKNYKGDFTDKVVDGLLAELIGIPGISGGKAQNNLNSQAQSGYNPSAYSSAQVDPSSLSQSSGGGLSAGSGIFGLIGTIANIAYSQYAAKQAYGWQNEFYNNHLSMPAKVQEYREAGLNPMALGGAGVGATSAPNVDSPQVPDIAGSMTSILGTLLNYKLGKQDLALRNREVDIKKEDISSQIEYRATQKLYQEKINEWFEANQIASIDKMRAETKDALQRVNTGEADELLKLAGVTKTEAESSLIFQEELQKLWENSPEWRDIELRLKRAQANSNNANAKNLYADIERIQAQRDNLIADGYLKVAQTEVGRQQLKNMGLEEKQIQFAIDHQRGDLIWDRVGRVTGALKDVGIGVAAVMTPIKGVPVKSTTSQANSRTTYYDKKGNIKGSQETWGANSSTTY